MNTCVDKLWPLKKDQLMLLPPEVLHLIVYTLKRFPLLWDYHVNMCRPMLLDLALLMMDTMLVATVHVPLFLVPDLQHL